MVSDPIRIGVVGLGYWGPNLARNFAALPGAELRWCCDASEAARDRAAQQHPGVRVTAELSDLLDDPELDAIALATPVSTHADLAVRVLQAGKHCFVEKPLAQSVADAERVVAAAHDAGRTLMVGHLLEYHAGVRKLKELADDGELGEVYYVYGNRLEPSASCGRTRTRWGNRSGRTTCPSCWRWPARSRPRWSRTARRTSVRGSRTSSSASCGSHPVWPRTCT